MAGKTEWAGIQFESGAPAKLYTFDPGAVPAGVTDSVSILLRFDMVITNTANPNDGRSVSAVDMGDDVNGCNIAVTGQ